MRLHHAQGVPAGLLGQFGGAADDGQGGLTGLHGHVADQGVVQRASGHDLGEVGSFQPAVGAGVAHGLAVVADGQQGARGHPRVDLGGVGVAHEGLLGGRGVGGVEVLDGRRGSDLPGPLHRQRGHRVVEARYEAAEGVVILAAVHQGHVHALLAGQLEAGPVPFQEGRMRRAVGFEGNLGGTGAGDHHRADGHLRLVEIAGGRHLAIRADDEHPGRRGVVGGLEMVRPKGGDVVHHPSRRGQVGRGGRPPDHDVGEVVGQRVGLHHLLDPLDARLLQAVAGPVQLDLQTGHRDPQELRDLVLRIAVHVVQRHGQALAFRQTRRASTATRSFVSAGGWPGAGSRERGSGTESRLAGGACLRRT